MACQESHKLKSLPLSPDLAFSLFPSIWSILEIFPWAFKKKVHCVALCRAWCALYLTCEQLTQASGQAETGASIPVAGERRCEPTQRRQLQDSETESETESTWEADDNTRVTRLVGKA